MGREPIVARDDLTDGSRANLRISFTYLCGPTLYGLQSFVRTAFLNELREKVIETLFQHE